MESKLIQCPICKGKGKVTFPLSRKRELLKLPVRKPPSKNKQRVEANTIMAKLLRREGYSFSEIANFLGYASKRSVQLCLQRNTEENTDV